MLHHTAIETMDIVAKKYTKSTEDASQLEVTHPVYGSKKKIIFDISCIQIDRSDSSRCFVNWENTNRNDDECWLPFNLETSENIADLECSFPDYREKLVDLIPETPSLNKRSFGEMEDEFANRHLISQVHSLNYVYSLARSIMDQIYHLALAVLLDFLHEHPVKINTIRELQDLVEDCTEHDIVSRGFLMHAVTHFVRFEDTPSQDHEVHKRLKTIHGVGDVRAAELMSIGVHDVTDLRDMLTQKNNVVPRTVTRALPFYEDLQKRIPRMEVEGIASIVRTHGKLLWKDLHSEVLGSYCRGARSCGDVDMLMTSPTHPSMNSGDYIERIQFLHNLVNSLKSTGVIMETMSMTQFPKSASHTVKGSVMFMGIVKIAGICRHLDIKVFPHNLLPFCQLHFIGNHRFSKALRWYTKQKGFRLSELGLRRIVTLDADSEDDTDLEDGDIKHHRVERIKTEQDIFYALRLRYVPPHLRQIS